MSISPLNIPRHLNPSFSLNLPKDLGQHLHIPFLYEFPPKRLLRQDWRLLNYFQYFKMPSKGDSGKMGAWALDLEEGSPGWVNSFGKDCSSSPAWPRESWEQRRSPHPFPGPGCDLWQVRAMTVSALVSFLSAGPPLPGQYHSRGWGSPHPF